MTWREDRAYEEDLRKAERQREKEKEILSGIRQKLCRCNFEPVKLGLLAFNQEEIDLVLREKNPLGLAKETIADFQWLKFTTKKREDHVFYINDNSENYLDCIESIFKPANCKITTLYFYSVKTINQNVEKMLSLLLQKAKIIFLSNCSEDFLYEIEKATLTLKQEGALRLQEIILSDASVSSLPTRLSDHFYEKLSHAMVYIQANTDSYGKAEKQKLQQFLSQAKNTKKIGVSFFSITEQALIETFFSDVMEACLHADTLMIENANHLNERTIKNIIRTLSTKKNILNLIFDSRADSFGLHGNRTFFDALLNAIDSGELNVHSVDGNMSSHLRDQFSMSLRRNAKRETLHREYEKLQSIISQLERSFVPQNVSLVDIIKMFLNLKTYYYPSSKDIKDIENRLCKVIKDNEHHFKYDINEMTQILLSYKQEWESLEKINFSRTFFNFAQAYLQVDHLKFRLSLLENEFYLLLQKMRAYKSFISSENLRLQKSKLSLSSLHKMKRDLNEKMKFQSNSLSIPREELNNMLTQNLAELTLFLLSKIASPDSDYVLSEVNKFFKDHEAPNANILALYLLQKDVYMPYEKIQNVSSYVLKYCHNIQQLRNLTSTITRSENFLKSYKVEDEFTAFLKNGLQIIKIVFEKLELILKELDLTGWDLDTFTVTEVKHFVEALIESLLLNDLSSPKPNIKLAQIGLLREWLESDIIKKVIAEKNVELIRIFDIKYLQLLASDMSYNPVVPDLIRHFHQMKLMIRKLDAADFPSFDFIHKIPQNLINSHSELLDNSTRLHFIQASLELIKAINDKTQREDFQEERLYFIKEYIRLTAPEDETQFLDKILCHICLKEVLEMIRNELHRNTASFFSPSTATLHKILASDFIQSNFVSLDRLPSLAEIIASQPTASAPLAESFDNENETSASQPTASAPLAESLEDESESSEKHGKKPF